MKIKWRSHMQQLEDQNEENWKTMENIGANIKYYRKKRHLTQTQLAQLIGYRDAAWVSLVENGYANLNMNNLERISKALKVKKNDLSEKLPEKIITPTLTILSRQRKWQLKNPYKSKVHYLTTSNPELLIIIYECACDHPNKELHHFDYTRPFEVMKLCPECHRKEHIRLRNLANQTYKERRKK